MPTFRFKTIGNLLDRNPTEVELPDLAEARTMAARYAGELLQDLGARAFTTSVSVEVADQEDVVVLRIDVDASEGGAAT